MAADPPRPSGLTRHRTVILDGLGGMQMADVYRADDVAALCAQWDQQITKCLKGESVLMRPKLLLLRLQAELRRLAEGT